MAADEEGLPCGVNANILEKGRGICCWKVDMGRGRKEDSRELLFFSFCSQQRDSARNLEWLKTVKESHGSVELSSLSLATAINKRGVYVIQAPVDGQVRQPTSRAQLAWR